MKIVEPKVEYWCQEDTNTHIARCARVCYASNNTKNNDKMCEALWNNKHRSMFRHAGVYYIIPAIVPVKSNAIGIKHVYYNGSTYISANEQSAKEHLDENFGKYRVSVEHAENCEVFYKNKLIRYTFCIETGIDITREYNRKSPNAIAEQSTRYVDFVKKVGIRFKRCHWMFECNTYKKLLYKFMLKTTELFYKLARSKYGLNLPPQDARFILPLDTMSKVVYTYTVKEWEDIINMRLYDYTGAAHPDAKVVAKQIKDTLEAKGYTIYNYKKKDESKLAEHMV